MDPAKAQPTLIMLIMPYQSCQQYKTMLKMGGTTLNGGEEGGEHYIAHKCDQLQFEVHVRKASFLSECLNIFATGCSIHCTNITTKICTCNACSYSE